MAVEDSVARRVFCGVQHAGRSGTAKQDEVLRRAIDG